jgi:hypothetical protein
MPSFTLPYDPNLLDFQVEQLRFWHPNCEIQILRGVSVGPTRDDVIWVWTDALHPKHVVFDLPAGGIYLDPDVVLLAPFPDLPSPQFITLFQGWRNNNPGIPTTEIIWDSGVFVFHPRPGISQTLGLLRKTMACSSPWKPIPSGVEAIHSIAWDPNPELSILEHRQKIRGEASNIGLPPAALKLSPASSGRWQSIHFHGDLQAMQNFVASEEYQQILAKGAPEPVEVEGDNKV